MLKIHRNKLHFTVYSHLYCNNITLFQLFTVFFEMVSTTDPKPLYSYISILLVLMIFNSQKWFFTI